MDKIKLIVGLSNPGKKYKDTRHNLGAKYIFELVKFFDLSLKKESKFLGYFTTSYLNIGKKIHLLIPNTFMNENGNSVFLVCKYYNIDPSNMLVVHDDLDLQPGIAKFKKNVKNDTHNGIRSITKKLNQNTFFRLRIGIGKPKEKNKINKYLLNTIKKTEKKMIFSIIKKAIISTNILIQEENFLKATQHLHSQKLNIK